MDSSPRAFADPVTSSPEKRVFNVDIQGQRVLEDFEPAREANGAGVVKEFPGIRVNGELSVQLSKADPNSEARPVLSGVEIRAEGW